ncbi:hypothetical protein IGI37_001137 [Enterococcus sp. AZ194]|uniref:DUF1062 domain-containing protein n=1 Tax=Enterococcus sp. AZ194 TaxID=2774629 RepID=UPI003F22226C
MNHLSTPTILLYCKKCGQDEEFICSDCFRINAQKKFLDVWLIYNCAKCKTSWNSTILSRIHTNKIDAKDLQLFQENSVTLSRKYGSDKEVLKRNGVKMQTIAYEVIGESFFLDESVRLQINYAFPVDVKLATILKDKLELSNSELKQYVRKGGIHSPQTNIFKGKLHHKQIVLFNEKQVE